ncbi:NifB/NifX family molybdenum-iron cluster-binding protein [bacterium]|nr:NifB/NifX family molybdenum-iron cluster-binding protein [bacterium]
MRVGIAIWGRKISPVLDVSEAVLVVEFSGGERTDIETVELGGWGMMRRARLIGDLGLDTLICGALSDRLAGLLAWRGVRVIPWVSGDVDDVLSAFVDGKLSGQRFAMPGCRGGGGRGLGRGGAGRGGAGQGGTGGGRQGGRKHEGG